MSIENIPRVELYLFFFLFDLIHYSIIFRIRIFLVSWKNRLEKLVHTIRVTLINSWCSNVRKFKTGKEMFYCHLIRLKNLFCVCVYIYICSCMRNRIEISIHRCLHRLEKTHDNSKYLGYTLAALTLINMKRRLITMNMYRSSLII